MYSIKTTEQKKDFLYNTKGEKPHITDIGVDMTHVKRETLQKIKYIKYVATHFKQMYSSKR